MSEPLTAAALEAYFSDRNVGHYGNFNKLIKDILEKGLNFIEPMNEEVYQHQLVSKDQSTALFLKELAHRLVKPDDFKHEPHPAHPNDLLRALHEINRSAYSDLRPTRYARVVYQINSLINSHLNEEFRSNLHRVMESQNVRLSRASNCHNPRKQLSIDGSGMRHSEKTDLHTRSLGAALTGFQDI